MRIDKKIKKEKGNINKFMGGVCLIAYLCIFFNIVPYNQNKMSNWYFQLPDLKDGDYIRLDLE